MAELNCGFVTAVVVESQLESIGQDRLKTPADRHDEDKEKSADLVQAVAMMMELLRPMPALSLRPQAALTARSSAAKENIGMIGSDETRRRAQGKFFSEAKGNAVSAARTNGVPTSGQDTQSGVSRTVPLVPLGHDGDVLMGSDVAEVITATALHSPMARKSREDVTGEAALGSSYQQHVGQRRLDMMAEKVHMSEMRRMQDTFVDVGNRSGDSTHAQGWTYQFKTWGREHAVTISPSPGTSSEEALLSLRPTSHLVEQRLQSHPGDPAGSETWVLHEHNRDQEQHREKSQQDDAQEDEQ